MNPYQSEWHLPDEAKIMPPSRINPAPYLVGVAYEPHVHFPLTLWIIQKRGFSIPFISLVE